MFPIKTVTTSLALSAILLISPQACFADENLPSTQSTKLPEDLPIPFVFKGSGNSVNLKPGDTLPVEISQDIKHQGVVIFEKGTPGRAIIKSSRPKAKYWGNTGEIIIQSVQAPDVNGNLRTLPLHYVRKGNTFVGSTGYYGMLTFPLAATITLPAGLITLPVGTMMDAASKRNAQIPLNQLATAFLPAGESVPAPPSKKEYELSTGKPSVVSGPADLIENPLQKKPVFSDPEAIKELSIPRVEVASVLNTSKKAATPKLGLASVKLTDTPPLSEKTLFDVNPFEVIQDDQSILLTQDNLIRGYIETDRFVPGDIVTLNTLRTGTLFDDLHLETQAERLATLPITTIRQGMYSPKIERWRRIYISVWTFGGGYGNGVFKNITSYDEATGYLARNFTNPIGRSIKGYKHDKDPVNVNYYSHPNFWSRYGFMLKGMGASTKEALITSQINNWLWEGVLEGTYVPPSGKDLITNFASPAIAIYLFDNTELGRKITAKYMGPLAFGANHNITVVPTFTPGVSTAGGGRFGTQVRWGIK